MWLDVIDSQKNVHENVSSLTALLAGSHGAVGDWDICRYIYDKEQFRKWGNT